jgi:hypothetical protein
MTDFKNGSPQCLFGCFLWINGKRNCLDYASRPPAWKTNTDDVQYIDGDRETRMERSMIMLLSPPVSYI